MEIFINLNNQGKSNKKMLQIFSGVAFTLAILTVAVLVYDFESATVLIFFYAVYFILMSISFFMQSKGKSIFDLFGKSYIKMDDSGFEIKMDILNKRILKADWSAVTELKIKLFEIQVKIDNHPESINLEKLNDDNLKPIKQRFEEYCTTHLQKEFGT